MSQNITDHDIISRLPRAPEKRSIPALHSRLGAAGHRITMRSLQRRLISLMRAHPIICDDSSKPYGWSISADSKIALGELSVQEAVALKLSERYLREAMPADLLSDLVGYFAQANAKLKHASLYSAWLEKVRVVSANQPLLKPYVARNILAVAYDGVLKGQMLNVTYRGAGIAKAKTYDIHPLAIIVRGSVSYLVAQFPWASDVSLMALHRFTSVKATAEKSPANDFDIDDFIANGRVGFLPTAKQTLRVCFYENAGAHLLDTPISPDQKLRKIDEGTHALTVRLPITEQLKWWLFGFGERAEVLSPTALRAEFKARLSRASKRYKAT
jgi:predicted DNA-binding transcriptional regulator YafY